MSFICCTSAYCRLIQYHDSGKIFVYYLSSTHNNGFQDIQLIEDANTVHIAQIKSQHTQEKEEIENKHKQDVRFVHAEYESVLREEKLKCTVELAVVREESARIIEEHTRR